MAGKTQLSAGEYTVQGEGAGPHVELKITPHNRLKATLPTKVIPGPVGGRRLLEIRFSGKKFFLQIKQQPALTTCADPPLLIPECESALPW